MSLKNINNLDFFRLIPMRIRFRASDFGRVAKKTSVVQSELHVRNRMRRWCSGHLLVCSCDSAVRFLDVEKSSQCRLPLCLTPRRVHFDPPWTLVSQPALIESSLAAKRRAEALHVVFFFIRAHHDDDLLLLLLLLLCTLMYI